MNSEPQQQQQVWSEGEPASDYIEPEGYIFIYQMIISTKNTEEQDGFRPRSFECHRHIRSVDYTNCKDVCKNDIHLLKDHHSCFNRHRQVSSILLTK